MKDTMDNIDGEFSVKKEGGEHSSHTAIGTKNNSLRRRNKAMKKTIVNKIAVLVLAVIAVLPQNVSSVFAAAEKFNSGMEYSDIIPEEIHVGDIIGLDSEKSVVIEVDEDGSFKTVKISESTYALAKCNHISWKQVTNPVFKGKQRANSSTICYYNMYVTKYKCANKRCSATRNIETGFPVKHTFNNGKCTVCGRKKK